MPTRNVVLTEHQEALISSLVAEGRYQNASEVLREGIRLVEREEREFEARLEAFQEAARRGWKDLDDGRYTELSEQDLADHVARLGRRTDRAADAT